MQFVENIDSKLANITDNVLFIFKLIGTETIDHRIESTSFGFIKGDDTLFVSQL